MKRFSPLISGNLAACALVLLLAATASAQTYGSGTVITIPRIAADEIVLDGEATEAVWSTATEVDPFANVDNPYSHKGYERTTETASARFLYADGVFYVYFEVTDGDFFQTPAEPYDSDVALIGVDLLHQAGDTDQRIDNTFGGFAGNAPLGPVVYQAVPQQGVLLNWGSGPDPVASGYVDGTTFVTPTSWGIEMAIYSADKIVRDAQIGLNVGLFLAKEEGYLDRNNGEGGTDYAYSFASWQVCDSSDPNVWCGPGGTMLMASHSFATAHLDPSSVKVSGVDEVLTFESDAGGIHDLQVSADNPTGDPPPPDADFPAGFISFEVDGLAPGASSAVTFTTDKTLTGYYKHGLNGWYEFPAYDEATGVGVDIDLAAGTVTLHLKDGELGDKDETVNGTIVDPGAPAFEVDAAIEMLQTEVASLDLKRGLEKSFMTKLENAGRSNARGRMNAASGQLGAFVNHVKARRGKDLNEDEAGVLVTLAEAAIDALQAGSTDHSVAHAAHPAALTLDGSYPNPFNPQTSIRFSLSESSHVRLTVYDALGREVAELVDGVLGAGPHTATFDAGDRASGLYLYRIETQGKVATRSIILMK